jgi:hypothetical protein
VDFVPLLAEVFLDDKISPGLQLLFPVPNQRAIKKSLIKTLPPTPSSQHQEIREIEELRS